VVVGVVAMYVTTFVSIGSIIQGDFGETRGRLVFSALAVAVYCVFSMAAAAVAERSAVLAIGGWGASGVGLSLALVSLWSDFDRGSRPLFQLTLAVLLVAFSFAHASGLEIRRDEVGSPALRTLFSATQLCIGLVGGLGAMAILGAASAGDAALVRLIAALAVLDVLGTLVLPLLRKTEEPAPAG
jgi:hypothetical protein